jgi:DNA repair protein RadA/Sms
VTAEHPSTCSSCQHVASRWLPRCPNCKQWNTLVSSMRAAPPPELARAVPSDTLVRPFGSPRPYAAAALARASMPPMPIDQVTTSDVRYVPTTIIPLDHVLGGGIVAGAGYAISALPGTGKSQLTLQMLAGLRAPALYATGEETREQVAATWRRLKLEAPSVQIIRENQLDVILQHAATIDARIVVIDSIQKMRSSGVDGEPGTASQVKISAARASAFGKDTGTIVWIICQVDKDGAMAGPMAMAHEVDVVLELAAEANGDRVLRVPAGKNRFGDDRNVGRFVMTDRGLEALPLERRAAFQQASE